MEIQFYHYTHYDAPPTSHLISQEEAHRIMDTLRLQKWVVLNTRVYEIQTTRLQERVSVADVIDLAHGVIGLILKAVDNLYPTLPIEEINIDKMEKDGIDPRWIAELRRRQQEALLPSAEEHDTDEATIKDEVIIRLFDYGLPLKNGYPLAKEMALSLATNLFLQNILAIDGRTYRLREMSCTNIGEKAGYICFLAEAQ